MTARNGLYNPYKRQKTSSRQENSHGSLPAPRGAFPLSSAAPGFNDPDAYLQQQQQQNVSENNNKIMEEAATAAVVAENGQVPVV